MPGSAAPATYTAPKKFTAMIRSASSAAWAAGFSPGLMPALFTTMSIPPKRCCASRTTSSAKARSDTSPGAAMLSVDERRHCSTTSSRRSLRRATAITVAPRSASRRAVAAPMPDDAPVTTAIDPRICMAETSPATAPTPALCESAGRMNISMLLEMVSDGAPDRVMVGARDTGLTAVDLHARARRAAALFLSSGVEHVGLVDVNSEALPLALFGAALAGIPFAPVNYRLTDDQLRVLLPRLAPGLVIAGADNVDRVKGVDGLEVLPRDDFLAALGDGGNDDAIELPFVDPDEIAILLFTSGTTGDPKTAVLRHRHLTSYILGSVEFLGAADDDAQLVSVPPYHIAGVSAVLSSLFSGRRVYYLPSFEPDEWVRAVNDQGITQAMVVPTMLGRVLASIDAQGLDCASLRHLSYGGGRMPVELIERAMGALPTVNFVNAYGLTETSSTIAVLTPDDHREAMASDDPVVRRRLGSVGRPLPSVELEIRDFDGKPVAANERGEVYVRGEQVAGEYLGRSGLTDDGWFPTKDLGFLDDDGFLFLEGRIDDVIVRGGENLSPAEIEDALIAHPAVAEVAVVGVPDEEWGETVAAAIVLVPGEDVTADELKQWVRERLRSTRAPTLVQFRDEMPYNETGKLLRRVIREELRDAN